MKTKFLYIFFAMIILSSCMKSKLGEKDFPSVHPFNYSTVKEVIVKSENGSNADMVDVFNQEGEVLAVNIPSGTSLIVANDDILRIEPAKSQLSSSATRAGGSSTIYFPSKSALATLMFEDEYPYRGDYDMNDIVVGFKIQYNFDSNGDLTRMYVDIKPYAIGSTKKHIGLALMLHGDVSIEAMLAENIILQPIFSEALNSGLEPSTSGTKFVVPLTGDLRAQFVGSTNGMINTLKETKERDQAVAKTLTYEVTFKTPVKQSDITFFGVNSSKKVNCDIFAIFNERSNEVHLKGMQASDRFDASRFKRTGTLPNRDNLFCDKDNFVWAIMTPKFIPYPTERTNITNVYSLFQEWVTSDGKNQQDWYETYSSNPDYTFILKRF